jgi:hypothetical protein
MEEPPPSGGKVWVVAKPWALDRRSISITAARCTPGAVMQESTSNGSTPPVIANGINKA